MRAAVASGADAVYFGVDAFNARQRAENFRLNDLPEVVQWLHQRDVKGFLTFNVLVFSDELEAAAQLLIAADEAGVDAVIVQDVGLCRLAQRLVPHLCVHGSTQMSITSAAGVAQAAALGCQRVVLARELALHDLERLTKQLGQRNLVMPLEVFVHGALCVAYSGQCLTSESSANAVQTEVNAPRPVASLTKWWSMVNPTLLRISVICSLPRILRPGSCCRSCSGSAWPA